MISLTELKEEVLQQAQLAKIASKQVGTATAEQKNRALLAMAEKLWARREAIFAANHLDVEEARATGQSESRIDRLILHEKRLKDMMEGLRQVSVLPDPVGEVVESFTRADGLRIERVRVPIGVIAMVYESRPNVTADAAGLALKTGNAVILRGGKEALRTNRELVAALREGLAGSGLSAEAIQFINRTERDSVDILIQARGLVDLAIPRGGAGLIGRVVQHAQVPVIETGVGNCHVFVDAKADLGMATEVILNAKTQRPSVCNAMETLLVHEAVGPAWMRQIVEQLQKRGVEIRGCEQTRSWLEQGAEGGNATILPAGEEDWADEFLDLVLAIKVVKTLDEAIEHIDRYGTKHSEAIVTDDVQAAETFLRRVDAAAVYHNASTRFTDGFEYGFGAEIGISTQKLHARGPMGLRELTSYKYIGRGTGQVRS
ncbi:glutamate-5-semialdehyde dehydrogenase [Laceyella putida]|uniref:Gamma-glutamyl phosphate reductase n=1 Tax=Laceyella putida TaxID=110101 RepID=A0ABW2RHK9_9BACL